MIRFVYKTTNLLNGKIYIGQHTTENPDDGYMGSGVYLQKAIKEDGKENFTREIISWADSKKDLDHAEEFFIKHYIQKVGKSRMYNATEHAGGVDYHTDESKKKMSAVKKGHTVSEEHKQKISIICKNHPALSKKVLCVETGEIYPSISEACRQTGAYQGSISNVCIGKYKTAGGFHWKFVK